MTTGSLVAHEASNTISLRDHITEINALRDQLAHERDRRYAEVDAAKAEALKIKEAGDARALELARDIQSYKDERDNRLREQISSERGLYITRVEFKPIADFVIAQQGGAKVWALVAALAFSLVAVALSFFDKIGN